MRRLFGAAPTPEPVAPPAPPPAPAQVHVVSCAGGTLRLRGPGLDHRQPGSPDDAQTWAAAALAAHAGAPCGHAFAGRPDGPGPHAVTDWACLHLAARYWIGALVAENGHLRLLVPGEPSPLVDLGPGEWSWAPGPADALAIETGPTVLQLVLAGGEATRRDFAARNGAPARVFRKADADPLPGLLTRGRLLRLSLDGVAVPARRDALRAHAGGWALRVDATVAARPGAAVSLAIAAADGIYESEATVTGIWSVHGRAGGGSGEVLVRLGSPMAWTRHNLRSTVRCAMGREATLEVGGAALEVRLTDLSVDGAGLRSRTPVPAGAAVVLALPDADGPLRLPGRVVRARPRSTHQRIGVLFGPVGPADSERLRALLRAAAAG